MKRGQETLMPNWALEALETLSLASDMKLLIWLTRHRAYRENTYSTKQLAIALELDIRTVREGLARLREEALILSFEGRHCSVDAATKLPASYQKAPLKKSKPDARSAQASRKGDASPVQIYPAQKPENDVSDGENQALNKGTDELMNASYASEGITEASGPEIDLDDLFAPIPDLPSQENNLAPVPPETHPANSAHSTVPGRGAAASGEATRPDAAAQVFFHELAGPRLTNVYAAKVPKWAAEYTPEFIRLAWDHAPTVKGAHLAIHAFAWLLNREREWPEALQRQYKADLKAKHVAPEDRVPVLGEILVCGPNSGRVLEVFPADRLVSIQTGPGDADYLTVPWSSTQPAVRRSA